MSGLSSTSWQNVLERAANWDAGAHDGQRVLVTHLHRLSVSGKAHWHWKNHRSRASKYIWPNLNGVGGWCEGLGERLIRLLGNDVPKWGLLHYLAGNVRLAASACCQNLGEETCILSSRLDSKTAQQLHAQIGKEITSEQTPSPEN